MTAGQSASSIPAAASEHRTELSGGQALSPPVSCQGRKPVVSGFVYSNGQALSPPVSCQGRKPVVSGFVYSSGENDPAALQTANDFPTPTIEKKAA
jgi:hypothetical protein